MKYEIMLTGKESLLQGMRNFLVKYCQEVVWVSPVTSSLENREKTLWLTAEETYIDDILDIATNAGLQADYGQS